jgi:transposase InsO family protein
VVHFNVTAHPTADWTAQQLREAFPFDQIPRYLLRDRDKIFGDDFRRQVKDMQIQEVLSAPRSPWQRAYVERVIGSIRRECLDHVFSTKPVCSECCHCIFPIITKPGLTFPWKRIRQSRGKFKGRSWAECWRYPESADCTIGTSGTLPDAIFLTQRRPARRISAPACATIGVLHERHSRLAEFSSARFRLQYPPRQPTERSFGFSITTVCPDAEGM